MIIALVSIWVIFTLTTGGSFLTQRNLSNLLRQMSGTAILATGMVFVIVSGEIDLSVGSGLGLLGGIAAILNVWYNFGDIPTIIIVLVLGLVLGFWNGFWVAYRKVPSFIVTLAGLLVFRGVLIGISKGQTVAGVTPILLYIGQGYISSTIGYILSAIIIVATVFMIMRGRKSKQHYGLQVPSLTMDVLKIVGISVLLVGAIFILDQYQGIPFPVLLMGIIAAAFTYISSKTVFGRRVYATGGNVEAAKLSSINVKFNKLMIFGLSGMLAAIAGILLMSRLNAGSVSAGQNAELDAIAACVIGGTSMLGGIGTVSGALVGALVMASIDNGMSMLNASPFWQYIVKGLILLLAVWVDVRSKNKE
jgi:D-xylose transport system permease protein